MTVACGLAEVQGGRLYYEVAGQGKPLVLIHGGNLDRRMWDDQFEGFAQDFKVVRYDMRGHGRSEPPGEPYYHAQDLCDLVRCLGLGRPHLVGLSLGARIAVDLAIEHPDIVDCLVLAAPGLGGYRFARDSVGDLLLADQAVKSSDLATAVSILLENRFWKQIDPELGRRLRQMVEDHSFEGWRRPELVLEMSPPAIQRLGAVTAPTLVIVGDEDVADIRNIAGMLQKGISGAQMANLSGAGHMLNMQKPEQFNRAVRDFLSAYQGTAFDRGGTSDPCVVRLARRPDAGWCVGQDSRVPADTILEKIAAREVILAESQGGPVGYLRLERLWSKIPYISMIRVLEPHRRQGIGRAMLAFLESLCRGQGHRFLLSSSQANEPEPQAWHRAMGFEECGIIAGVNEGAIGEVFFRKRLE
jgi:pimeloyl-ACP methyl ester carboxylesterase/GNAT superfamily N-acetyltransferase